MAQLAIARGGGARLRLEDSAGEGVPSNAILLDEVASLCRDLRGGPAKSREAAEYLGLP